MQIQTPSFIFCKLRQLFSDNVFTFSFLLITTLYLSADWFMDRYFMPKNISFVVGIILWGGICIGNWKRKIRLSVDFLFSDGDVCRICSARYLHDLVIIFPLWRFPTPAKSPATEKRRCISIVPLLSCR